MEVKFYHDLSETFDTKKIESLVRESLDHDPNIMVVSVETSAMRGGDPVFLRIEALDNWGQWNDWGGGYMHLSREAAQPAGHNGAYKSSAA